MEKTPKRVSVDLLALDALQSQGFDGHSMLQTADLLDVSLTAVWRAFVENNVTPELLNGMVAAGYLDRAEVAAVLTVEVPPCLECNEAHTVPWCTDREGEPVKPYNRKSNGRRKHPPTLKIRTDDVESAAASILRSYPEELRTALLERLAGAGAEE